MHSSKADEPQTPGWGLEELGLLATLGFGPDSLLMCEPKVFVDAPFLAALQVELEDELGPGEARVALFQIGVIHGLRDALRIGSAEPESSRSQSVECPPLAMRLGTRVPGTGGFELSGAWPERYEAQARLAKLGRADSPSCTLSAGYTSGWLSGALERDVLAVECSCAAAGDEHCTFVARETEAWRELGDERALELLGRLSIESLRAVATGTSPGTVGPGEPEVAALTDALPSALDPSDPAIHVWGPVMVMPFAELDLALQTIDLLGRDPGMRGVRVVVLDLCGTEIDDDLGAAGLERLIENVQSWGAEIILTGISPMSDRVVADLEATHLLSRKDLPEAIAYAFQIAEAQRHLL